MNRSPRRASASSWPKRGPRCRAPYLWDLRPPPGTSRSRSADQHLVATTVGAVMDLPVVPAARLESDVVDGDAAVNNNQGDVALADEVLRDGVVRFPVGRIWSRVFWLIVVSLVLGRPT